MNRIKNSIQCRPNSMLLIKACVGISLLALLANQLIHCLDKYIKEPTYTETSVVDQHETEFPAVTFCSLGNHYYGKRLQVKVKVALKVSLKVYHLHVANLQEHGIDGRSNYISGKNKFNLRWSSNQSMTTPQELYEQVTVSRNQLLKEINLQLVHKETEGTLYRTLNLSNSAHINEKRDRYRGRCYTFHPSHQLRKLGIYRMHITLYVNRFCPNP